MKNWIRVTLVCSILVGGTAFIGHQVFNQFDEALNNLGASYAAIANMPPIPVTNKTNTEHISTTTPEITATTTPEMTSPVATSTALKLSLAFPKKGSELYIGCTYQIPLQSSTTVRSLGTTLIDAGTKESIGPIASGLAREIKIEADSQILDWKVGAVWPGEYFILISKMNGVEIDAKSKSFMVQKLPGGISASKQESFCKESSSLL